MAPGQHLSPGQGSAIGQGQPSSQAFRQLFLHSCCQGLDWAMPSLRVLSFTDHISPGPGKSSSLTLQAPPTQRLACSASLGLHSEVV